MKKYGLNVFLLIVGVIVAVVLLSFGLDFLTKASTIMNWIGIAMFVGDVFLVWFMIEQVRLIVSKKTADDSEDK